MSSPVVFDAGGLIALERGHRRMALIMATALEEEGRLIVPATVVAQVLRDASRQVRLWRFLNHKATEIVPLNAAHAQGVGALLRRSGTSDIADAHVVLCAQEEGSYSVVTSDPLDLRRLDRSLPLVEV